MKKASKFVSAGLAMAVVLASGCSHGNFAGSSSTTTPKKKPEPIKTEDTIKQPTPKVDPPAPPKTEVQPTPQVTISTTPKDPCDGNLKTQSVNVVFPATGTCLWGQNGNLNAKDGRLSGRQEQVFPFNLPADSIICNWKMTFPPQGFNYDDYILLAFNGHVLMSSNGVGTPPPGQDFNIYTWDNYRTGNITGGPNYCVGQDQSLSECAVLANRQDPGLGSGTFFLNLDPTIVRKLGEAAETEKRAEFLFVTSGDNDSTDCQHSPLNIGVDIEYAKKE